MSYPPGKIDEMQQQLEALIEKSIACGDTHLLAAKVVSSMRKDLNDLVELVKEQSVLALKLAEQVQEYRKLTEDQDARIAYLEGVLNPATIKAIC